MSGDNRLRAGLLRHCSGIRPRHSYILQTSEGFARKDIRMLTTVEDICQNEGISDKTWPNVFHWSTSLASGSCIPLRPPLTPSCLNVVH